MIFKNVTEVYNIPLLYLCTNVCATIVAKDELFTVDISNSVQAIELIFSA